MQGHPHFFSLDTRRDVAHPGNREATLLFAVEHFINCAKEAFKLHGYFAVALSGGSTPKAVYEMLASPPHSSEIDWKRTLLFWSDERSVPPSSKENNFWMAMEAGFKKLEIPGEQIFRMVAEENLEENAALYDEKIRKVLGLRPFDLILLGMGEDGHTASLFPNTKALEEKGRWVVKNEVPQLKTSRMTMTYPCINRSRNTVIYALGKEKKEMLKKVLSKKENPSLPASLVGTEESKALWIMDSEAGELLLKIHHTKEKGKHTQLS